MVVTFCRNGGPAPASSRVGGLAYKHLFVPPLISHLPIVKSSHSNLLLPHSVSMESPQGVVAVTLATVIPVTAALGKCGRYFNCKEMSQFVDSVNHRRLPRTRDEGSFYARHGSPVHRLVHYSCNGLLRCRKLPIQIGSPVLPWSPSPLC